jgi:hypothetical protein
MLECLGDYTCVQAVMLFDLQKVLCSGLVCSSAPQIEPPQGRQDEKALCRVSVIKSLLVPQGFEQCSCL